MEIRVTPQHDALLLKLETTRKRERNLFLKPLPNFVMSVSVLDGIRTTRI